MIQSVLRLQKPLEDYVEYFDTLTARSIPLITKFTDISIAFQDSTHNVRGQDAAQSLLRRRFELIPSGRYQVYDFTWGRRANTAYLRLGYTYNKEGGVLKRSEQKTAETMIEIGFSPDGNIASHTEFWLGPMPFDGKGYQRPL